MDNPANDPIIEDCANSFVRMMRLRQFEAMRSVASTFPELDPFEIAAAHDYALALVAGIAQSQ